MQIVLQKVGGDVAAGRNAFEDTADTLFVRVYKIEDAR